MKLTKDSIIKQLCHELLQSEALNLRAEQFIGEGSAGEVRTALARYQRKLRQDAFIRTGDAFTELQKYVDAPNTSKFFTHFQADAFPLEPSFCATSLFQPLIISEELSDEGYDDVAQSELIGKFNDRVYRNPPEFTNGVQIAAETGNEEMLRFLLRPEFQVFDLTQSCIPLLLNARISESSIRQIIFKACAERIDDQMTDEMMQDLLAQVHTIEEWRALFDSFHAQQQVQLLHKCTAEIWGRLITNQTQFRRVERVITQAQLTNLFGKLLTIKERINDGHIILQLMERMNQAERLNYATQLSDRINTLFSSNDPQTSLAKCLTLLGYEIHPNGDVILKNIFGPPGLTRYFPLMNQLHTKIWSSPFNNQMKLRYFRVVQQLLVAPADSRQPIIRQYLDCVKEGEEILVARTDAERSNFMRWIRSILRFFGIIKPLPMTQKAQKLFKKVNRFLANNQRTHATLLDLNEVILPEEPDASSDRILAITRLTEERYDEFWSVMTPEQRAALLMHPDRFSKLLQTRTTPQAVCQLLQGLGDPDLDRMIDVAQPSMLIHLLQQPLLPTSVFMESIGERRQNSLLSNRLWLREILANLPKHLLDSFLHTFTTAHYDDLRMSLEHLQTIVATVTPDQYPLLVQYFRWDIPIMHEAYGIGQLLNELPHNSIAIFWSTFLPDREFTAADMATLVPNIQNDGKKRAVLTHWMSLTHIRTWSRSLIPLLPYMTHDQQAAILSMMTRADLVDLIENDQVQALVDNFTPANAEQLIDKYRNQLTTRDELIAFLKQINATAITRLIAKPIYAYFRLLDCSNFVTFIRELALLDEPQWQQLRPKLFNIGLLLFPSDTLINYFRQYVPEGSHGHLFNVLREIPDENLLLSFFSCPTVDTLIRYGRFNFTEITSERIIALAPQENANRPTDLLELCERNYDALIQSHLQEIHTKLDAITIELNDADQGLFKLLEMESSGVFFTTYKHTAAPESIIAKWTGNTSTPGIVHRYTQICKLHDELVQFYAVNRFRVGIVAFKLIHDKLDALETRLGKYVDEHPILSKSGVKLPFPAAHPAQVVSSYSVIDALKQLKLSFESLDKVDEAHLLEAVPESALATIMNDSNELQQILDLTSALDNKKRLLTRCRLYLSSAPTAEQWLERLISFSPSSLNLLLSDPTEGLIPRRPYTDFLKLIHAFHELTESQWHNISPKLLSIGRSYFGETDLLCHVLIKDVPLSAHIHILNLIRTTDDIDCARRLLDYLKSPVVRELRKLNQIDYFAIKIEKLPQLEAEAPIRLNTYALTFITEIDQDITALNCDFDRQKTGLMNLLRPTTKRFVFFYAYPQFGDQELQNRLHHLATQIDSLKRKIDQFQILCGIDRTLNADVARKKLESYLGALTNYLSSKDDKNYYDYAPACEYKSDSIKIPATHYLNTLSSELTKLIEQMSPNLEDERLARSASRRLGSTSRH
jgi:hypothetical protein